MLFIKNWRLTITPSVKKRAAQRLVQLNHKMLGAKLIPAKTGGKIWVLPDNAAGIDPRHKKNSKKNSKKNQIKIAKQLANKGVRKKTIAKILNVDRRTVYNYLNKGD